MEKDKEPTLKDCLEAVKSITKGMICSEEDLQSRARIMYLINRLQTFENIKVFVDEAIYQRKLKTD